MLGSSLRLAFYLGSDGPRLMIFGPLDADFGQLQDLFRRMSRSPGASYALHEEPFITAFGGVRVTLVSTGPVATQTPHLHAGLSAIRTGDTPSFEWHTTAAGWDHLAELVGGLIACTKRCHQYLTRYPLEDAIVVLSKGEYGDDVIGSETGRE